MSKLPSTVRELTGTFYRCKVLDGAIEYPCLAEIDDTTFYNDDIIGTMHGISYHVSGCGR